MTRAPQTTLIIPGVNGSGPGHWQDHWLLDNANALLVDQEDWACPRIEDWLYRLEAELVAHPGAILVAHSLGTLLVAHLASRPAAAHVAGALLVAPCDLEVVRRLHPGARRFGAMPQERLPFPALVVGSTDDPYMADRAARALAERWEAGFLSLGAAGHINVGSGFGRWEDGYALAANFARDRLGPTPKGALNIDPLSQCHSAWSTHGRETVSRVLASNQSGPPTTSRRVASLGGAL